MRHLTGSRLAFVLSVLLLVAGSPLDEAAADGGSAGGKQPKKISFSQRVNKAIDRGVVWLKKAQLKDGSWGPCVATGSYQFGGSERTRCHKTGPTAFSLFTLASCGMSKKDRVAKKGLSWLKKPGKANYLLTTYESSVIVLMLCSFHEPERVVPPTKNAITRPRRSKFSKDDWRTLREHMNLLIGPRDSCVQANGGFGYWSTGQPYADVSATQFAVLALRSAFRAGYPVQKVRPDVWAGVARYLTGLQESNGGFPYHKDESISSGMTAAALASLILCREQITAAGGEVPPGVGDAMKRGRDLLGRTLDVSAESRKHYHYCHLYAIERIGMLSGKKVLGGKDWYTRGAEWLLSQEKGGRWVDKTCMDPQDILGTCFALLFLKRATIPVVTPTDD